MFPEMEGEFNRSDYPDKIVQIEESLADDGTNYEYESYFEYPYGTFTVEMLYSPKPNPAT